jgi:3-deoxy-D-manno-octulosonate 8-phosphate phosphatase (KDO 8-P phosphatase)
VASLFDPELAPELRARAERVRGFVLDVDGVLTDGSIVYDAEAREIKSFHVWDGFAVKVLQKVGFEVAILSGRRSPVVAHRAAELGVREVLQGHLKKRPAFLELVERSGKRADEFCVIGDDLPDLALFELAGLAAAPGDAHPLVQERAHYVAQRGGGRGAVREVTELVLFAQGRLAELSALFA